MLGLFGSWFGNSTPQAVPPISPAQVSTLFAPQRMPMNRDNIVSQIFAPPYWTPSDLDYYGGETPQMRFNFRKFYRTEPSLKAALDGTTSSLSSSETSVIPEDKDSPNDIAAAEFNEWGIEQTPRGMRGLIEDINRHARLDGYFVGEIKLHQVTPEESSKWAGKWRVDHVRVLDTIWINLELDVYRNIVAIVNTVRGLEYYDPSEVIFYSHKPLYNVPFGQSDFRATTRAANILEDVYKVWYVALKLYGYPYLIGKVKSGTRRQMMENALTALHASGYAVTDVEESIDVVNLASAASYDAFQTMIQTQREDVNMVFRGSSLPFQEGQGGNDSHGDTQVASKASDAEEESMGFHIAHTIRRQLFNLVTAINFPRGTGVPHLQLGGTNWDTTAKRVATMKDAQSMGAKIKKAWFYKETGIVPADDNDPNDALEAPKEPSPDGGGMPGSGGPPGAGPQPPFGGNPASPKPKPPAPTEQTMSDGSRSEYVARLAAQLVDRAKGGDTFADEYDRDENGRFAPKGLSGVHAEWKRATGRTKEHLHDAYYNTVGEDPGEKPLRGRIDKKLLSRRVASAHAALHDAGGTAEELKPLERAALHAGLTKVHNTGDVTTFDPEMHVSDVGISEGTPVRVVRPGWHRDDGDGRIMRVVGAKVEPMPKQFSDTTAFRNPTTPDTANGQSGPGVPFAEDAADPHQAATLALLDYLIQCKEDGTDPAAGLDRFAELGADENELTAALGDDADTFADWDESKHPRDDKGRYVSRDAIHDAKSDPKKAAELRARVTKPEQRAKLDKALAGEHDLGRTKRGQQKHDAAERRRAKEASAAKAKEILARIHTSGVDPADIEELAAHLPALPVARLRLARQALMASWGGERLRKSGMVDRLVAHVRERAEAEKTDTRPERDAAVSKWKDAEKPKSTDHLSGLKADPTGHAQDHAGSLELHDAISAALRGEHGSDAKAAVERGLDDWGFHGGKLAKKYEAIGRELAKGGAKLEEDKTPEPETPINPGPAKYEGSVSTSPEEVQQAPGEPKQPEETNSTEPGWNIGTPDADPVTTPTSAPSEAVEGTEEAGGNPRDVAAAADLANKSDYEFARSSRVANAGEDLKGSARHKRNEWRGLADAEKNGTAAELVTRDNLLKVEPHNLMATIEPHNALSHLAASLSINAFPAGLDPKTLAAYEKHGGDGKKTPEELRAQFYEAYQAIKSEAERAAIEETDPRMVTKRVATAAKKLIRKFRGVPADADDRDYMVLAGLSGNDRFNPVANALVDLQNRASGSGSKSNHVMNRVLDFAGRVKQKYGEPTPETLGKVGEHVQDVIEGDSFNKTFGTSKDGPKRFNPVEAYVNHVTRKGGRVVDASTVQAGIKYVMDNLKMRGLQWGNSVTDDERQHHLTKTSEAMADLADVTGLPDLAMSLNGALGLAIGARGKGNASAHYEPTSRVINLTRKNGAGTLAHEWAHALDHEITGAGFVQRDGRQRADYLSADPRPHDDEPVKKAMSELNKAMKESGFDARLPGVVKKMQKEGKIPTQILNIPAAQYWASPEEKFARSFERFVQHKLSSEGRENTYLSGIGEGEDHHGLWPTREEAAAMAPAFDKLFNAIREKHYADHKPAVAPEQPTPAEPAKPKKSARFSANDPFGDGAPEG